MRKFAPLIVIVGVVFLAAVLLKTPANNPTKIVKPTTVNPISFPQAGDILNKGKTYTLKWLPGTGKTDIFLINHMLESEGVSVSIADRIYNIDDNGSYAYYVPKNIPDGEYKFQIGEYTSKYFTIGK